MRRSPVARTVAVVAATLASFSALASASGRTQQTFFSREALDARAPSIREHYYAVNARVRPLLLFWIGRDDVGGASMVWRKGPDGRRAFELLAGTDPAHAPRKINRWGFIVEEWGSGKGEVFGVMKESNEKSLEEAEEEIAREDRQPGVFKALRTTIADGRAVSGTMTAHAPPGLTYHDLDTLLDLVPRQSDNVRAIDLPEGTRMGFLTAMDSLMRDSIGACGSAEGSGASKVRPVPFVYRSTVYELSLSSCEYEATLPTKKGTFAEVIDGRFQIRNRTTNDRTRLRVIYGAAGDLTGVPVRAVFRPRWWMEIELVLDRSATALPVAS